MERMLHRRCRPAAVTHLDNVAAKKRCAYTAGTRTSDGADAHKSRCGNNDNGEVSELH